MDPTAEKIDAVGSLFSKVIESGIGKSAAVGVLSILLYSFFENRTSVLQVILTNNLILYGLGIIILSGLILSLINLFMIRADKATRETSMLKDKWLDDLKLELAQKTEIRQHILEIKAILEKNDEQDI